MHSCQDRTSEFFQIIGSLKNTKTYNHQNGYKTNNTKVKSKRQKLIRERAHFTATAKNITSNISNTCAKLEKLGNLIKTSSLFEDKTSDIQGLTEIIKSDLWQMTNDIRSLSDLNENSYGSRQTSEHSTAIVDTMQKKVKLMSDSFDHLLHNQLDTLKQQAERREMFAQPISSITTVGSASMQPQFQNAFATIQPKIPSFLLEEDEDSTDGASLLKHQQQEEQLLQQQSLITMPSQLRDQSHEYVNARSHSVQQVEATIVEMGQIFQQLSTLVHEHGQQIERISSEVDQAAVHVESGHSELLRLYQSATNNRWLMAKVFGVIFVFVLFFLLLLA